MMPMRATSTAATVGKRSLVDWRAWMVRAWMVDWRERRVEGMDERRAWVDEEEREVRRADGRGAMVEL